MRDSSPGPGTEDHTALWLDSSRSSRLSWQVPENGEVPNTTSQDTWLPGLLPTHLPDPFFFLPPETVEGLCLLWTLSEAEIRKIWTLRECFGKSLRGANLQVNDPSREVFFCGSPSLLPCHSPDIFGQWSLCPLVLSEGARDQGRALGSPRLSQSGHC